MLINYENYGKTLYLLFEDKITATCEKTYEDEKTKVNKRKKVKVIDNAPCRLSFNTSSHKDDSIGYSEVERKDILTTPPDIDIPVGSDVIVTRSNGSIYHYKFSDIASIHPSHRRYILDRIDIS